MNERLRIVVCGYLIRGPLGGLAWHHLQYLLGLHRLGHEVAFVEDSDNYDSCFDPRSDEMSTDPAYGIAFLTAAYERLALPPRWAYYDEHTDRWHGPLGDRAPAWLGEADLLLDVSGVNPPRPWWDAIPARALIDTDPCFTQLRHIYDELSAERAQAHTVFFTFGENVGAGAELPDDGLPWRPTRQPVVLESWPASDGDARRPWTTVMQWDSYREGHHAGITYGMKSRTFGDYADLPSAVPGERLELAVSGATAPREALRDHGWSVRDPFPVSRDPWAFQDYVARSKGEFSVAKHGYVVSRSGWFSERTAGYLASGRPAVVQDTGFSRFLPNSEGLHAFTTADEAAAAIERVRGNYARECRAAREIAEAEFAHDRVLERLVREAMG